MFDQHRKLHLLKTSHSNKVVELVIPTASYLIVRKKNIFKERTTKDIVEIGSEIDLNTFFYK